MHSVQQLKIQSLSTSPRRSKHCSIRYLQVVVAIFIKLLILSQNTEEPVIIISSSRCCILWCSIICRWCRRSRANNSAACNRPRSENTSSCIRGASTESSSSGTSKSIIYSRVFSVSTGIIGNVTATVVTSIFNVSTGIVWNVTTFVGGVVSTIVDTLRGGMDQSDQKQEVRLKLSCCCFFPVAFLIRVYLQSVSCCWCVSLSKMNEPIQSKCFSNCSIYIHTRIWIRILIRQLNDVLSSLLLKKEGPAARCACKAPPKPAFYADFSISERLIL